MPLSIRLTTGNKQVLKGVNRTTGETFYIQGDNFTMGGASLVVHAKREELYVTRVSEEDLIREGGNIIGDTKVSEDSSDNRGNK